MNSLCAGLGRFCLVLVPALGGALPLVVVAAAAAGAAEVAAAGAFRFERAERRPAAAAMDDDAGDNEGDGSACRCCVCDPGAAVGAAAMARVCSGSVWLLRLLSAGTRGVEANIQWLA